MRTRLEIRRSLDTFLLVAVVACQRSTSTDAAAGPLVAALRQQPIASARWGVRFSIPTVAKDCWGNDADTVASISCRSIAGAPSPEVAAIAGRAASAMRAGIDADAIHASALIDLASGGAVGNSLDRSISYLEMATQLAPRSSSTFSDLAAAHLVAAERRSDAFELLQALDAASRALELDPANDAARFNRALSLDLLALDGEAAKEWRRYLQRDSTSTWASRGRRYLTRSRPRAPETAPPPDASAAALAAFASRNPFEARTFAWEQLLGGWGAAVGAKDSARAASLLEEASVVSSTLATRFGDSSLTMAVRAIATTSANPAGRRRLAKLHQTYASALGRTRVNDHVHADSAYREIMADPNASAVLRQWATYGHANALVYQQRNEEALTSAERLLGEIDARHQPSLAGRARWMTGMARLRLGDNDAGLRAVNQARQAFETGGERENVLGAIGVAGEVALRTGDDINGYAGLHTALRGLREFPIGIWRHNVLYVLSGRATLAELDRAAEAIEDEDFAAAVAANRSAPVVEARLARARSLWAAGDTIRARAAIDSVAGVIASIPVEGVRDRFHAELNLTLATGPLREQRERASAMLDSVVRYYTPAGASKRPDAAKLVPALLARAGAALALDRVAPAEADLARATALFEEQRDSLSSLPLRAALLARARAAFESLITVRLAQGRVVDALDALERSRAFSSRVDASSSVVPTPVGGQTVIDYAMIGDTLFAWVVDSTGVSLARTAVERSRLSEVLAVTRAGFELSASDSTLRPLLTQLFEWFVRPVGQRIRADSRALVVVADPDLASVPTAALFDARRGSYLVESHAIRFASTLREGAKAPQVNVAPASALFVASPTVDPNVFPSLADLPYSQREVQASAALYAQATVEAGTVADSASIVAGLLRANVFHFAGHALFDDARPERSRLVVRPRGVSAATISTLDLRRLRLVVLSACESMRVSDRRGSGFAGLSEAFLGAGAGGVIGSSWRVSDASTAELMREFHMSYRKSGDATDALRMAQLVLLRSSSVPLRTPASWGAFRYAGN